MFHIFTSCVPRMRHPDTQIKYDSTQCLTVQRSVFKWRLLWSKEFRTHAREC